VNFVVVDFKHRFKQLLFIISMKTIFFFLRLQAEISMSQLRALICGGRINCYV